MPAELTSTHQFMYACLMSSTAGAHYVLPNQLFWSSCCACSLAALPAAAIGGKKSGDGTQKLARGEEAASENGNGAGLLGTIFKTVGTQRSSTQGKRGGRGGPDAGTGG